MQFTHAQVLLTFKGPVEEMAGHVSEHGCVRVFLQLYVLEQIQSDVVEVLVVLRHLPGDHHELGHRRPHFVPLLPLPDNKNIITDDTYPYIDYYDI